MASLTETAKAVLEGKKNLQEGAALPTVGPLSGGVSNPNPVDPSTASTANAKTLHPGSKTKEDKRRPQNGAGAPGNSSFEGNVQDLGGATPTSVPSGNLGAAAAGGEKRDTSIKGSGSNAEPTKKLSEDEEKIGRAHV